MDLVSLDASWRSCSERSRPSMLGLQVVQQLLAGTAGGRSGVAVEQTDSRRQRRRDPSGVKVLAVLPVANYSGDPAA